MNWSNVKLILQREVRDQLRDRRTLFVIAVLPLLLYPLLGTLMLQFQQFMREHKTKVLIVGLQSTQDLPPLIEGPANSFGAVFLGSTIVPPTITVASPLLTIKISACLT